MNRWEWGEKKGGEGREKRGEECGGDLTVKERKKEINYNIGSVGLSMVFYLLHDGCFGGNDLHLHISFSSFWFFTCVCGKAFLMKGFCAYLLVHIIAFVWGFVCFAVSRLGQRENSVWSVWNNKAECSSCFFQGWVQLTAWGLNSSTAHFHCRRPFSASQLDAKTVDSDAWWFQL